jgi:hypothetical protein
MSSTSLSTHTSLRRRFESALPRILGHARVVFRFVRCWHTKQDRIQEVSGLCWEWIKRLHQAGKPWWTFVSRLADYACRAVKSGRKVAGMISAKDVMNEITQTRKSFCVGKLPDFSTESGNPLSEALTDNTRTPPDEQAMFRLDFSNWLATLDRRRRSIALCMATGERTKHLARKYRISQGRVSQLRRQFKEAWQRFVGDFDERGRRV